MDGIWIETVVWCRTEGGSVTEVLVHVLYEHEQDKIRSSS